MTKDDDFRIRPGRIRSSRSQRARPFIAQALAAAQRAGGGISRNGAARPQHGSRFGRGRVATVRANRLLNSRSRGAMIKARVVRHGGRNMTLATHLGYLRREGVTRDGEKVRLFGPDTEEADPKSFADRCEKDRHHFRFIVSPDDAVEMTDLKGFTRDLMSQAEKDLETQLDWVAVDHWNTEHPHIHVIVRGIADDGADLRDFARLRQRKECARQGKGAHYPGVGPRTELDIRHTLERQIEAERWTQLDRRPFVADADRHGVIDLAPVADQQPDEFHALKVDDCADWKALDSPTISGQANG